MKARIILLFVCIVVVVQIGVYIHARRSGMADLDSRTVWLENRLRELKSERNSLIRDQQKLWNDIQSVPEKILQGFEDPEAIYLEFLDYLENLDLKEMDGQIKLLEAQLFKAEPVPLYETNFQIDCRFVDVHQVEGLLRSLLLQEKYPLQIKELTLSRPKEGKPAMTLKVALLLPAKVPLPKSIKKASKGAV